MKFELSRRRFRFSIVIIVLLLPALLTSCFFLEIITYGKYKFLHESEPYEKMTIQIVEISSRMGMGSVDTDELNDEITLLTTISDKENFLEEFKQIGHNYPLGSPPFGLSSGKAVLLVYSDGKKELIAKEGCALIEGEITEIQYHGWFFLEEYEEFMEKWTSGE